MGVVAGGEIISYSQVGVVAGGETISHSQVGVVAGGETISYSQVGVVVGGETISYSQSRVRPSVIRLGRIGCCSLKSCSVLRNGTYTGGWSTTNICIHLYYYYCSELNNHLTRC